ncbi:hypothetical protein SAMN06265349_101879 [Flavobacterium resistens]|uniref:Lipoprotein n=1 Tax=Flavobacterium resistens TaxID=443612 RepID=A0A521BAV7_9FLAO|nr:hypothetical protein [Flavobacterium resistens]MRX67201.1 hypothetical protein [Flavobacterium resistens]SMO44222.1 hypothetical protein SAMN06265349_101879 [Flavobacterium resistens]
MKKIVLILVIIALSISCKKADAAAECVEGCAVFYFENPQPDNDAELDHFPNKFRGLYVNNDSTFIRIDEDRILEEYFYKFKIHKLKLDSLKADCDIVDGKLMVKDTKYCYDMFPKGDSIELVQKNIDTLFRFSLYQKAKRIDGQLILSRKDSIFWKIRFVSLDKNILKFKNIYDLKDLKKLDSVTKIKAKKLDSISYLMKPARSEFKKIFKIKHLGYDQEYKKVSK